MSSDAYRVGQNEHNGRERIGQCIWRRSTTRCEPTGSLRRPVSQGSERECGTLRLSRRFCGVNNLSFKEEKARNTHLLVFDCNNPYYEYSVFRPSLLMHCSRYYLPSYSIAVQLHEPVVEHTTPLRRRRKGRTHEEPRCW